MVTKIPLTQGKVALVDDEDAERVQQYRWFAVNGHGGRWYAGRNVPDANGGQRRIHMHRLLLGDECEGKDVDHINSNTLDNCRENLRACTRAENMHNMRARSRGRSRYKGVAWEERSKRWRAMIRITGHRRHLGYFVCAIDAARAYDDAARGQFGEYARLNFPGEGEQGAL